MVGLQRGRRSSLSRGIDSKSRIAESEFVVWWCLFFRSEVADERYDDRVFGV